MGSARTFNKQAGKGAGTFGSSARRPEQWLPGGDGAPHASYTMREVTPGPGQYEDAIQKDEKVRRRSSSPRPSSAFATRTEKGNSYCKPTDAPLCRLRSRQRVDGRAGEQIVQQALRQGQFWLACGTSARGPALSFRADAGAGRLRGGGTLTRPATADISRRESDDEGADGGGGAEGHDQVDGRAAVPARLNGKEKRRREVEMNR